ncbi:cobalamin-dependent protein, partial [Patescibacteria group bacterium]|nr:cobalamin-dependent protein [Patescibacteria group bacterium]
MKDQTVCLILPPSEFLADQRVFTSLGILLIAAVLRQKGVHVHVLDLSKLEKAGKIASIYALEHGTKIFGITATTPQMPDAVSIVNSIREVCPDARIILGGPHATLTNAGVKKSVKDGKVPRGAEALNRLLKIADVVIAGDGEKTIFSAIDPNSPKGLIDSDDPKSPFFLTDNDLDNLPLPARDLVDLDSYHYYIDGERSTSIISQLGCPFVCAFCGGRFSAAFRRIRNRSIEKNMAEINHIREVYGYKGFMFYDDELNVSPLMIPLMQAITKRQKELREEWRL